MHTYVCVHMYTCVHIYIYIYIYIYTCLCLLRGPRVRPLAKEVRLAPVPDSCRPASPNNNNHNDIITII